MQQLREGLWRWTGLHPDWEKEPDADWPQEVGCVYYEAPDTVVLIDPLIPPEDGDRFLATLDRDVDRAARSVTIILSVFWHERSSKELAERYGGSVWADERTLHRMDDAPPHSYGPGDSLPGGIVAYDAFGRPECVLWIERHRALAAGDILHGGDGGVRLCPDDWLREDVAPAEVRAKLRPLLDLPIELVLTAHGEPVVDDGRNALARALAA